jgi:lysophospholipase L1-like esterase
MIRLLFVLLVSVACFSQTAIQRQYDVVSSGLIHEWRFDEGSGTTLTDYGSGACNGTLTNVGGSGAPAWSSQGLTFTAANKHVVQFAAGCFTSAVTIQVFLDGGASNAIFFGYVSTTGGYQIALGDMQYTGTYNTGGVSTANGSGNLTSSYASTSGPSLVSVVTGTTDAIYVNDLPASVNRIAGNGSSVTHTQAYQLGGSSGPGQGGYYSGTMYYALVYNRALTTAEIKRNYDAISREMAKRGVNQSAYNTATASQVVCVGDSLMSGYISGVPPCSSMTLTETITKTVRGHPSGTSTGFSQAWNWVDPLYAPLAPRNVIVYWAGTNDLASPGGTGTKTPQQTFDQIAAFCQQRRAKGWKVVVVPMISRTGNSGVSSCDGTGNTFGGGSTLCKNDAVKNELNRLLRLKWTSFADAFADIAQDTGLGADGAYANPTAACGGSNCFHTDNIHLTTAGDAYVAAYLQKAVERLFSAPSSPTSAPLTLVTATTYTVVEADQFVRCDPSGGSQTITLPTAIGATGRIIRFKNIQSAGANTVTLGTTASQTIDGASTKIIANLATVSVYSNGTNWEVL